MCTYTILGTPNPNICSTLVTMVIIYIFFEKDLRVDISKINYLNMELQLSRTLFVPRC